MASSDAKLGRKPGPSAPPKCRHSVEFYEAGFSPAGGVAEYFYDGLAAGEGMLTIATVEHVRRIRECLIIYDIDVRELERAGICTWLDAEVVLASLRANGTVSQSTVDGVLCPSLHRSMRASPTKRVRVFGELVDLLVKAGDYSDCVELEKQWNRLLCTHEFQLHCAYSVEFCSAPTSARLVHQICELHHEVKPMSAESVATNWLAVLVEQARALHRAMEMRMGLEEELSLSQAREIDRFSKQVVSLIEIAKLHVGSPQNEFLLLQSSREWNHLAAKTLKDILNYCGEVIEARRSAAEGSPEWHKRTGEILACARLTSFISELEECASGFGDLVN